VGAREVKDDAGEDARELADVGPEAESHGGGVLVRLEVQQQQDVHLCGVMVDGVSTAAAGCTPVWCDGGWWMVCGVMVDGGWCDGV
jgi:hypothetical protein